MQDSPVSNPHRRRVPENVLCALSYITIVPATVMLLLPRTASNGRIRFHACQSILLNWLLFSVAFLLHLRAGIDRLLDAGSGARFDFTALFLCIAVWGLASLRLALGHNLRIPFVASLAETQATGWLFRRMAPVLTPSQITPGPSLKQAIQLSN